jgi:DNA repair exonuclease SbcCD ATPase subunit
MAWYEDKTRKTYVATYSSERLMRSEVEAAARFGFVTQDVAPHKQGWTVTYYRDERRWARIQVEQALKQISLERDKLRQMESKIVGLRGDLQARFQAARKEASSPTKLESALLKAISDLISDRRAANTQRQTVLATYRTLDTARAEAAALKEEILQANLIDIDKESAPLRRKFAEEEQQLQQEEALRQAQQAVLKAVQAWQNAIGDRWGLHGKVEGADKKLTSTSTLLTAADARESGKIATKVRAAEAELAKHQTKLETIETVLQQRENYLLRELEARDTCMAALSFVS